MASETRLVPGKVYRMKPWYEAPLEGGTAVMFIPDRAQAGDVILGRQGVRVVRVSDFNEARAKLDRGEPLTEDVAEYRVSSKHLEEPRRGRPRRYASNADRQREYRRRKRGERV
jgi:hypothetical protein